MALPEILFPDKFAGMQLLPGPYFLKGSWSYSYFVEGNSWNIYYIGNVITINFADHLITPGEGENFRTDWFDCFIFPNGYKLQYHIWTTSQPYTFAEFRLLDENGEEINWNTTIPGMNKGAKSRSQGVAFNLPAACMKFSLISHFATNPGDPVSGPLPGTAMTGLGIRYMIGGVGGEKPLNYPEGGQGIKQCMTFIPFDEVHAAWQDDVFGFTDVDAANTYFATHGNPIPSDYPFLVPSGLPQDFDPSRPGGGDGNYSDRSDPIDFPDVPTGGALACGAIHAFHVTPGKIEQLFEKLWSTSLLDLDTWQKLVSSPLDCIISLHCLPFNTIDSEDPREIYFGSFKTLITAPVVVNQYKVVDCGYLDIIKFFGSAMDYSPYTEFQIYLPFSGIHTIKVDDVQGSRIHVKYNIDVLTGECVINVKCGQSVLYKFTGNCKQQIPVTARDTTALGNAIAGAASVIGAAGKGFAVGGAAGAIAGGVGAGIGAAVNVALRKETVSRSGDLSGSMGILDEFVPYLIIHRPQQSLAVNYNKFKGYPSNLTLTLGSCQGYTEVEHIHLTGITGATDTELEMIENQLKEGVII